MLGVQVACHELVVSFGPGEVGIIGSTKSGNEVCNFFDFERESTLREGHRSLNLDNVLDFFPAQPWDGVLPKRIYLNHSSANF